MSKAAVAISRSCPTSDATEKFTRERLIRRHPPMMNEHINTIHLHIRYDVLPRATRTGDHVITLYYYLTDPAWYARTCTNVSWDCLLSRMEANGLLVALSPPRRD